MSLRLLRLGALALVVAAWAGGPAPAADLDPYLPADTEMVVTINVRQIVDSELFKKNLLAEAREALKGLPEVNDVLKDLGFDPFKDLDRVIVARPGGPDKDRGLVIARGRFDAAKFKAKAEDAARDHGEVLKAAKVPDGSGGHFVVYEVTPPNDEGTWFAALAGKDALLVAPRKDYVVGALKQAKAGKKPALKNKDAQALLARMDPKQSVSVGVVGKALAGSAGAAPRVVRDLLKGVEAVGGGVTFGEDVKMEVVVAAASEKEAKALRDGAERGLNAALVALALLAGENKQLGPALDVVKTVKVTSKGKVVTFKARVTADVVKELLNKEE
jgi:hypothetical protein